MDTLDQDDHNDEQLACVKAQNFIFIFVVSCPCPSFSSGGVHTVAHMRSLASFDHLIVIIKEEELKERQLWWCRSEATREG